MAEAETKVRWNLTDLFGAADAEQIDLTIRDLEQAVACLESARPSLSAEISTDSFLQLLATYETTVRLQRRLAGYAFLRFAEDTQDQAALSLQNRFNQLLASTENRLTFFELWFKDLPDDAAQRLIAASGDWHYFLESWRRLKPFTLTEPEERVITLKDVNGVEALLMLYDMITNAFSFTLEVDGERKTLTQDEIGSYVRDPRPEVRAAAYQEMYRVYMDQRAVLAQIYAHRVGDWHAEMIDLRKFGTPISARNTMNDIPDAVVETLLSVCRDNAALFQRYFRLKAGWLGQDRLRRYDIYAPLAPSTRHYSLEQAVDLVLGCFRAFSPVLADAASRVFDSSHLDAEPRLNKRSGAFCYAVLPELAPWVLTNFSERGRDVSTLAHELGHAIHAVLAADHSVLTFDASPPLAETASVFGEMLLAEKLLAEEQDVDVRRNMLATMVDDAYVTVQRQAYFTLFEQEAHRLSVEGKTADELAEHYWQNLTEQFGDAVELSDEFRWEWTLIPHIYHTPFYTYAYSFAQLLVLALYHRYTLEGAAFKPKYLKILSYGGSASPATILAEAGFDMTSRPFWQGGFDYIASLIDRLEGTDAAG
jgi:oligoendopeptidase F